MNKTKKNLITNNQTKISPWNNPKVRGIFFQILIITIISLLLYSIFRNTMANLKSPNNEKINLGFDFLEEKINFDITTHLIPYSMDDNVLRIFWVGLTNTLFISIISIFTATIFGVLIGVSRLSKNWIVSKMATVYVEIFRNIPLLLQILFWYYAVLKSMPYVKNTYSFFNGSVFVNIRGIDIPKPIYESGSSFVLIAFILALVLGFAYKIYAKKKQQQTGIQKPVFWVFLSLIIALPLLAFFITGQPISLEYPVFKRFNFVGGLAISSELVALWFSLSIYSAAFIAENVRSGIMAVKHGQTEAAHSLGISPAKTLRLVIIPQALRVIIPPVASQYLNIAKNSSLAIAIAYPELVSVFTGTVLNKVRHELEIIFMTMLVYLTISLIISMFMNWYNSRIALFEK